MSTAGLLRVRDRLGTGLLVALSVITLASCGGERQDVNEPEGEFPVRVVSADFPSKQQLAGNTNLTLSVANTGDETVPDLAVTIFTTSNASTNPGAGTTTGTTSTNTTESTDTSTEPTPSLPDAQGSFSIRSDQPGLAIPFRPVWILEEGFPKLAGENASAGATSAQTDTFSFGPLDPNETRQMVWNVTPVVAGTYTVHYRIAAGLQGKAEAVTADGSVPEGEFVVQISSAPPQTRVDESGKVVPINPGDIIGQAGSQEQKSELGGSGTTTSK